ncbi:MAG: hypothetical protein ACI87E_003045 [Mariniblastus sp.]|jgi:hypothetical protein
MGNAISSGKAGLLHPADEEDQAWNEPKKLTTAQSKIKLFLFMLAFTLFWNGVTFGVGGAIILKDELSFLDCLMVSPFVFIGFLFLLIVGYMLLGLFNPKFEVAMSKGAVPLGGDVDIAWELIGNSKRIRKLKIEIHGVQSATFRRGTNTFTDTETFEVIPICSVENTTEIEFGSTTTRIPVDTMHSFNGLHNSVNWEIKLNGEIPWWPDVYETFPFRVKPSIAQPQESRT